MLMAERKPATVGEMLREEFIGPLGLSRTALADAAGFAPEEVDALCDDAGPVTASIALILARVFGNSADFWLNVQRRTDLWEALHSPEQRARIAQAKPLATAA